MKNILVTGGTGYIGSHTVVELLNKGYNVVIIDNLSNSNIKVLDGIEEITGIRPSFYEFDLCDKGKIEEVFKVEKFNSIIHFAAHKAVGESIEKPLKYYRNNLLSLINLLELSLKYNVFNFVFSSSCVVYGETKESPINEKAEVKKPTCPYGNTKKMAEEIIEDVAKVNKDINIISLRYFNPIGAHETALIGELPVGVPANLIPYVTQTAIGKREELKIFGGDYDTPDGTCIRDYIHVVDLAKAHISAVERLINKKNHRLGGASKNNLEIFNLGTGKGASVLEVVKKFEEVTGVKVNYKIVEKRKGDIVEIYANTTLANNELGWKAEKSLGEALLSSWNWEKANESITALRDPASIKLFK